jgi:multiple antibiotic resistance protein
VIIATIGFGMLFPKAPTNGGGAAAEQQDMDIAFTPIAMPSLAGPGSISVVLTAAANIRGTHPEEWQLIYLGVILGMAATLVFSYLVLQAASWMVKFMGRAGIDAMTRIFGFLLVCIGTQFLLTGIDAFFHIRALTA